MTSVKEIWTTSQEAVTVTMDVEERDRGELMLVTSQPQPPMVMGLMPEPRLDRGAVLTEEIETTERVTNVTTIAGGVQPANNRSKIFIKGNSFPNLILVSFQLSPATFPVFHLLHHSLNHVWLS